MELQDKVINDGWQRSKVDTFWSEIAPSDHVVQIYDNEMIFLNALTGFVGGGINAGDCCIVIATEAHIFALENQLKGYGIYTEALTADNRYIPLNANEVLSKFMVNDMPDENLFIQTISEVFEKARADKRKIRAFGEMVVLLWETGNKAATIRLEELWNKFIEQEEFCLFCAYPKKAFDNDINSSLTHICCSHSKMIGGSEKHLTEVLYCETKVYDTKVA